MRLLLVLSVLLGVVSAGTGPKKHPNLYTIQEEFEKNLKVFTWAVKQMSKSQSWAVGVKCDECLRFLKYMQGFATNTEGFITKGKEMCTMIHRAQVDWKVQDLCIESVERYGQVMAHILRNWKPVGESEGAQLFCNAWLGTCPAVKLRYNVPMNYTRNETPPPRPKPSGQMPFKFVHFSDLHLDPHYFPGTQSQTDKCPYPLICCRAFSEKERDIIFIPRRKPQEGLLVNPQFDIAGPWGHHGACDTPNILQQSFYRAMKKFAGDADFAIFTGGILSRQVWNSTAELNIGHIERAYSNMSQLFDFIYPAVGNDESSPANLFQAEQVNSRLSTQWLYDKLSYLWSGWIGDKDARRVKDGGFYSTKVPHRNLRIISLNTNLYSYKNLWVYQDPINHDPAGQLAWLVSELDAATLAKEHVYIIGHMSMGDADILQHYSRSLNQIMNKYGSTIAAMFFGHTHLNQFQLHYRGFTDPQSPHWWRVGERLTAEDAIVTSYIAPSITPVMGAPAFNVFYVDPETFGVLDIVTYSSNMVDPYWEYDKGPKWAKAYSAKAVYGIPQNLSVGGELSPAFWHKVSERFDWDRTFYRLYFGRQTAWNEKQTGESQRAKDQCFIRGGIARDCLGIPGRGGMGGYLGITDGTVHSWHWGGIANTSGTRRIRDSSTSKPFTFALAKPPGRFRSFTAHARKLLPTPWPMTAQPRSSAPNLSPHPSAFKLTFPAPPPPPSSSDAPNITTIIINQQPSVTSASQHPSPRNTSRHAMAPEFHAVTPILRIFDVPKADEFYLEYLGFTTDWEHRHDANAPLYRQISHGALTLHLSEHHGDGSPGVRLRISTSNLAEYHAALTAKRYRYMRPGLEDGPAEGSQEMTVLDPFGNTLIFCQEAK